jgi:uncharacterized protein (TIGR03437 family)
MQRLLFLVFLTAVAANAQPSVAAVLNTGSNDTRFNPGLLVSIYGKNFGTTPTVTVGTKAAFVVNAVATQINAQLPVDLTAGPTSLTVTAGGQTSTAFAMTIDTYAPAFFILPASGVAFSDVNGKAYTNLNPIAPGGSAIAYMVGLGPTSPVVATGQTPTQIASTTVMPTITVGGKTATVVFAGLTPGVAGYLYQMNFTVPKDAIGCNLDVILTISGKATPKASLPVANATPTVCAVQNGANQQSKDTTHGATPNSFVTIYTSAIGTKDAQNLFPATDAQGVEVLFDGKPVPLYAVFPSAGLINVVVPSELAATGTSAITVKNTFGTSPSSTLTLAPADVGIFWLPDAANAQRRNGIVQVAGTYQLAMPASLAAEYQLPACVGTPTSLCGQPAKAGDNIVIYLTGLGLATPNADPSGKPVATGSVAPADGSVLFKMVQAPKVTVGGVTVPIQFAGVAPGTAAEYQINVQIPPTGIPPGDDVPVVVTEGSSSDTVTISIQ